jgi:hypothetical protein
MGRAALARLADLLIPGGAGMPPARQADVAGAGLDRVLAAEPRHGPPLVRFLALAAGADDLAALDALSRADAEGFRALTIVVANAYFMHPGVRQAIGYPGQQARDAGIGLPPDLDPLLARVTARGPVWRAPKETA